MSGNFWNGAHFNAFVDCNDAIEHRDHRILMATTMCVLTRWDSKYSKRLFPYKGWLEGLYRTLDRGIGIESEFFLSSSSNLQNKVIVLCPQLHRVVVKHKVSY
jgi:hypothetical protein